MNVCVWGGRGRDSLTGERAAAHDAILAVRRFRPSPRSASESHRPMGEVNRLHAG